MVTIAFKPMKGAWKSVTISGIYYDEDSNTYEMKVDKSDHKEQLHFVMNEVEARMIVHSAIKSLIKNGNLRMIMGYVDEAKRLLKTKQGER